MLDTLGYRAGNEPLPSGIGCLTRVVDTVGNNRDRKKAATKYSVSVDILNCLGKLTSEKGGSEARTRCKHTLYGCRARLD
jgi:hypothetical protein